MNSTAPTTTANRVYLETFGCQMNELDSELVEGHLHSLGYRFVTTDVEADIVLYNTCSVREQAENKALSRVGRIAERKRNGENIILGILGCMAERDGLPMLRRHPEIDLLCGPGELDKLPLLLDNVVKAHSAEHCVALGGSRSRRSAVLGAAEDSLELLDLSRSFDPAGPNSRSAYVRITRGCNKFCTYCVVPHTRGAEVHRPPADIIAECRALVEQGALEITLLGQTINHYCYTHGMALATSGRELAQVGPGLKSFMNGTTGHEGKRTTSFADLLHEIHESVPELRRLRFVTSYPRDFSDDALHVIAESPRICSYLHVPAQSGSNRILKLMNRGYTVEQYLDFIDRAISIVPDISIAGDIIVGFPTETDEDYDATVELLRRVPFKNNFIFKYSPRPGTVAIDRFDDDVEDALKRQRNNHLLAVQSEVSEKVHANWVGKTVEVLVASESKNQKKKDKRNAGAVQLTSGGHSIAPQASGQASNNGNGDSAIQFSGRTQGDLITFFDAPAGVDASDLRGTLQRVKITQNSALHLSGTLERPLAGP